MKIQRQIRQSVERRLEHKLLLKEAERNLASCQEMAAELEARISELWQQAGDYLSRGQRDKALKCLAKMRAAEGRLEGLQEKNAELRELLHSVRLGAHGQALANSLSALAGWGQTMAEAGKQKSARLISLSWRWSGRQQQPSIAELRRQYESLVDFDEQDEDLQQRLQMLTDETAAEISPPEQVSAGAETDITEQINQGRKLVAQLTGASNEYRIQP